MTLCEKALSKRDEQIHEYDALSAAFPSTSEQSDVAGEIHVFRAPARTIAHAEATRREPELPFTMHDIGVPKMNLRASSACTLLGAENSVRFTLDRLN